MDVPWPKDGILQPFSLIFQFSQAFHSLFHNVPYTFVFEKGFYFVAKVSLELVVILLPQPAQFWD